ncbi:MAG: SAM-dependent methyltransferase, partial [Aestuariivirgaceae bacterium]
EGQLAIGLAGDKAPEADVPDWAGDAEAGEIAEIAPVRTGYAKSIAQHVSENGGAVLFIDYGHTRSGTGDTLQAVSKHNPVDILHQPGECDLTAHVDFAELEACFSGEGLVTYGPVTQSRFLAGMGIAERLEMLSKRGGARERMKVAEAARRLVAGTEMGHLFKVLVATDAEMPAPQPFAQQEEASR